MKKILYIFAALAAFSCAGTIDDDDNTGDIPEEYTEPFTLSVDKAEVEADGLEFVTFSLKDAYEREMLTDKNALQSVNILSDSGIHVKRMTTTATFLANGTHKFHATFKGKESENEVTVEAMNRGKYEKYHKNVAIYKATATWCGPCAAMTKVLLNLNEDTKNHTVELCWHFEDELALTPPGSDYDCGEILVSYFRGGGVPTVVLDLKDKIIERSTSSIEESVWDLRADYPATCGLKLLSEYDEETDQIAVTAYLASSTGGSYDLGMALLLNDQVIPSGTNEGGLYSHIVKASTGNFYMYSNAIEEVEKNGEISRTWYLDAGDLDVDDLSVAVFALVKDGDAARIDNIAEVKVGESIDYLLNE